jgi:putative FmdB family regulatory protein
MPTYDYRCTKCKHRFELFHSITDDAPKRCPKCKARARRVPAGGAGLLFKGSGFYITDNRSSSYKEKAKAERSSEPGASSGDKKPAKEKGASGGEKKPAKEERD